MSSAAKHKCKICKKVFTEASGLRQHIQLHSSDNPYECHLCEYTGKTQKYLSRHIKLRHTSSAASHECSYCGKMFHYMSKLNEHLLIHTNSRPHKCDVCGKGYNTRYCLAIHQNVHKAVRPYKCLYCEYACNDKSTLRKHHERHTGLAKIFQCEKCLRNFKRKSDLRAHVSEAHLNVDLKTKPCQICGNLFKTTSTLNCHIKQVHKKVYETKCDICGLYISNRYNLKAHLRSHIDVKPFLCGFEGCGKSFKDKQTLVKHSVIHYPEQHHACEVCGRRFARAHRLRDHMRQHRPRVKDVTCDHCGVSFYSKNYLSKHILQKHILRAQFFCDACGFCAHNKPGLVMHIKAGHDPDLTCKLCKKVSKTYIALKAHYWSTHFVKYKSRTKTAKKKKKIKEVKIKEEPIEEDASLENIENDKHDISRGTDAEQAAKVKELMMNAVIATSDNLETLFRDLLRPPGDGDDDDIDYYDYPLLCDAKTEETAQEQIKEMLTKDQLSIFYGNKRKVLEKVKIEPTISDDNKPDTNVEGSPRKSSTVTHKLVPIEWSPNDNNSVPTDSVSDMTNKIAVVKDTTLLNNVTETIKNDSEHEIENSDVNKGVKNVTKTSKVKKKRHKTKTNKVVKKKNGKKESGDKVKAVKRNYIRRKLLIIGLPKVNLTNTDKTEETVSNATKSNTEIESPGDEEVEQNEGEKEEIDQDKIGANHSKKSMEIVLNSHQCYECFMLFDTKDKLLDHCKEHYNLCNDVMLKKCPLCDFVTHGSLPRHIKLVHDMDLKNIYRPSLKEKENESGSRYFYNVDSEAVDKIDIIPSVKYLNKMAYVKLDKLRRQENNKAVQKTKLVKKQGEWVVEKCDIDIKDKNIVIPDLKKIEGDYFESLRRMARVAKKEGKKFLFPCKECEKICQTLSALKLHHRHHDPDKKPFKPKVWKHKITGRKKPQETKATETEKNTDVDTKRYEKPKPIVNKHKCDPKLMEFYRNNIRGGDIEFWQFLKIYNRMAKDNVNDFKDLENSTEFGIHIADKTRSDDSTNHTTDTNSMKLTTTVEISRLSNKPSKFKRIMMLNRKDLIRRNRLKQQLREKINMNAKT